ncbi:MAG TPA: hypothetical protein PKM65_19610 [Spirochaetota bacterium]|nr:hypothetical protein [Spirochaetota bacterium]HNT12962.1 hypothetical protein [Spirochaetota bacterium]
MQPNITKRNTTDLVSAMSDGQLSPNRYVQPVMLLPECSISNLDYSHKRGLLIVGSKSGRITLRNEAHNWRIIRSFENNTHSVICMKAYGDALVVCTSCNVLLYSLEGEGSYEGQLVGYYEAEDAHIEGNTIFLLSGNNIAVHCFDGKNLTLDSEFIAPGSEEDPIDAILDYNNKNDLLFLRTKNGIGIIAKIDRRNQTINAIRTFKDVRSLKSSPDGMKYGVICNDNFVIHHYDEKVSHETIFTDKVNNPCSLTWISEDEVLVGCYTRIYRCKWDANGQRKITKTLYAASNNIYLHNSNNKTLFRTSSEIGCLQLPDMDTSIIHKSNSILSISNQGHSIFIADQTGFLKNIYLDSLHLSLSDFHKASGTRATAEWFYEMHHINEKIYAIGDKSYIFNQPWEKISTFTSNLRHLALHPFLPYAALKDRNGRITLIEMETHKQVDTAIPLGCLNDYGLGTLQFIVTPNNTVLLLAAQKPASIFVYTIDTSGSTPKLHLAHEFRPNVPADVHGTFSLQKNDILFICNYRYVYSNYLSIYRIVDKLPYLIPDDVVPGGKYFETHDTKRLASTQSLDEPLVYYGDSNGSIGYIDTSTEESLRKGKQEIGRFHIDFISSLSVSDDNKYLISGSYDGTCKIIDRSNHVVIATIHCYNNHVIITTPPDEHDAKRGRAFKYLYDPQCPNPLKNELIAFEYRTLDEKGNATTRILDKSNPSDRSVIEEYMENLCTKRSIDDGSFCRDRIINCIRLGHIAYRKRYHGRTKPRELPYEGNNI